MADNLSKIRLLIPALIFLGFSTPITVHDLRTLRIPDLLIYTGTGALLLFRIIFDRLDSIPYICAGVFSFLLFLIVRKLSNKGMGWADIKYSAFCGLFAGPLYAFIGYLVATFACGVYFLMLKTLRKYKSGIAVPFAPFMALGTLSATVFPIVKQLAN